MAALRAVLAELLLLRDLLNGPRVFDLAVFVGPCQDIALEELSLHGVVMATDWDPVKLILVHNHPSGDPTPSDQDIAMTAQVQAAAEALGLTLHDHIIVGKSCELSFRAQGYL